MKQRLTDTLKIVAPLSVALIVFALGLGIALGDVVGYLKSLPVLLPCVITFIAIAMIHMAVRGKRAAASKLQIP